MARLIDADALVEKFWQPECRTQTRRDFVAMVNYAPTVDAVPVVHGEWIPTKMIDVYSGREIIDGYICDQCGRDAMRKSNYCPNCGAKMDGGAE